MKIHLHFKTEAKCQRLYWIILEKIEPSALKDTAGRAGQCFWYYFSVDELFFQDIMANK